MSDYKGTQTLILIWNFQKFILGILQHNQTLHSDIWITNIESKPVEKCISERLHENVFFALIVTASSFVTLIIVALVIFTFEGALILALNVDDVRLLF